MLKLQKPATIKRKQSIVPKSLPTLTSTKNSAEFTNAAKSYLESQLIVNILQQGKLKQQSSDFDVSKASVYLQDKVITEKAKLLLVSAGDFHGLRAENLDSSLEMPRDFDCIYPAIESYLTQLCAEIASSFHEKSHESVTVAVAKSTHVPELLKDTARQLQENNIESWQLKHEIDQERSQLLQILNDLVPVIQEIILEFKCKHEVAKNAKFTEYFTSIVTNMELKIKIMEWEALNEKYNAAEVARLLSLKQQLSDKESALSQQRASLKQQLLKYKSAGREFEQIVKHFQQISQQVETVRRDLERFSKS